MMILCCYVSGDSCSYDSRAYQILEFGVSEFCSTVPNSHVKSRVCFRVLSRNSQRGRLQDWILSTILLALLRAKYACILGISNPVFKWESCKSSEWESVKKCSRLCKDAKTHGWTREWLTTGKPPKLAHEWNMQGSWRVMPVVTLQDKSPRLARPNSRLSPIARPSRQTTLFGKNWLFIFLLTLLYIDSYTHEMQIAFKENFERKNPREK